MGLFSMSRRAWEAMFQPRPRARPQFARRSEADKATPLIWTHGVKAMTKSEARARIKEKLGIPNKGRLPVGYRVRVGGE